MNYPHIIQKVYGRPWAIALTQLVAIDKVLQSRLASTFDWSKHRAAVKLRASEESDATVTVEVDQENEEAEEQEPSIAIIHIRGIVGKHLDWFEEACGGCSLDRVCDELKAAAADPKIKEIWIKFHTPGGTVIGTPETAALIREIDSQIKPVYGFCDSQCCSAGMWIASQCRAFYVTGSAYIGSVGVYALYLDESVAIANAGLKVNAIAAGKDKLVGASFQPLDDEDRARLQAEVTQTHEEFKAVIKATRPQVSDEHMEGWVYDGGQAVEFGFADSVVADFDEALELVAGEED